MNSFYQATTRFAARMVATTCVILALPALERPLSAQCNPNEILAGAADGQIHSLDPTTGATTLLTTSNLVDGFVNALAGNPDNLLAYYGNGTTVFAWDVVAGTHIDLGNVGVTGTLTSGAGAYANGHLYLGTEAGATLRVYDVALTSDGRALGAASLLFTFNGDWGDMVVVGDTLYLASGTALMSYDLATATGPTTINASTSNGINFQLGATSDGRLFTAVFPSNEIRETVSAASSRASRSRGIRYSSERRRNDDAMRTHLDVKKISENCHLQGIPSFGGILGVIKS